MDIIQGLVQAGSTAGRPALRIVSNNRTFDVINTVTSNVIFSILNDGSVGAGSTIYTNLITNYADSSSGGSVSTGGTGSAGVSSQWTTVGTKIYYNLGNIGIGTLDPIAPLHIYNNTITAVLPTEIVVAGATSATISGTTDRVISFPYTSDSSGLTGQTQYTFTTTEALICDILIVGGGGGGARRMGGGGGAGALIYITNQNLTAGAYTINIGNGGAGSATSGNIDNSTRLSIKRGSNGFDSEILFNSTAIFRAKGGGGGLGGDTGSDTNFPNEYSPLAGGSGGGNGGKDAGAGGLLSTLNIVNGSLVSVINNNASDSVNPSYVGGLCFGNEGGRGGGNDPWLGSGGGGAGSRGTDVNTLTTAQLNNVNTGGVGGAGKVINITGSDITYAGGGGGGIFTMTGWTTVSYYNDGGIGGGGRSGTNTLDPVQGIDGTGGGGGGDGPDRVGGARGGSGIVIIRYRRQTQSSVSNARLLLDATTTGTASIEFRRGVGADAQNDFRIINDTNSSLKLQCENSAQPTQSFADSTANIAWFSSNETIIHKNTTMNGRVGVGTVYHATRTLDVVGDANVSGTVSMGNLNISSSNSVTITNTITSNTTLTIGNSLVSLPNEIVVSPMSAEIVVAGTTFGTIGTTDRYISFPYSGSATTKDYTFTTTENLICDILVVGGGGCGGRSGGGGGTVLYTQNVYSPVGSYTVKVGNGGISLKTGGVGDTQGANGNDSDILFGATTIFKAKGGGFGAANNNVITGGTGGSGGGSESTGSVSVVSSANIISTNISSSSFTTTTSAPNGTTIRGNVGGLGAIKLPGYYYYVGGGGGGAGGTGGNGNTTNNISGAGGSGVNISITGTNIMYGSGGSGGVYNDYTQGNVPATPGNVTDGGGTGAYNINSISYYGSIPTAGRGGGGGGWGVNVQTGEQIYPRDGGSGIVIIRYRKPQAETVTSSIIPGTTERYISFPYSGTGTTKDYTITTTEDLVCDILVVGGGGAGGVACGAGGGAGGVVYAVNQTLPIGTYSVRVGRGGIGGNPDTQPAHYGVDQDGVDSSLMNSNGSAYISLSLGGTSRELRGFGGGGGGAYNVPSIAPGRNGGSGGGTMETNDNGFILNTIGLATQPATYWNGTSYVAGGNNGRQNTTSANDIQGGGGGGAGAAAADYRDGNSGVAISIIGTSQFYAAGGGAAQYTNGTLSTGIGGSSIGGNGILYAYNSTTYPSPRDYPTSGANGTGSGGGGGRFSGGFAGSGGSGIVIIRYRRIITSSSATINLLRGTVADANHDYRVGNYNGEFKVISSVSNTDTDYIKISTSGAITNPTGTASWNTGSDRRIKENIERASYDKCFENINKLELNRFNYVSGFNTVNRDKTQLGFIAQEVNDIFPKAISSQEYYTNELCIPDLLSIDITQINYSLYGAVKKLIKINKDQETKFDTFDRRLKTIETALNIVTEPITSNIIVEPITSNIIVDHVEPITSNIIVDHVEPITSNIIVDPIEPITSNIIVDNVEPITSNITVETIEPITSNIMIEPIEPITSNITVETIEHITSNIIVDNVEPITSNIIVETIEQITSNLATE